MGGFGSGKGTRKRRGHKNFVENYQAIDVNKFIKQYESELYSPNSPIGKTLRQRLDNIYLLDSKGWQHAVELFKISKEQCYLGGYRYNAHCPTCERRIRKCFITNTGKLSCRTCLNLAYMSQNQPLSTRMILKMSAIEKKLRGSIYQKPKNMHWKTFNIMVEKHEKASEIELLSDLFSIRSIKIGETVLKCYGDVFMAGEYFSYQTSLDVLGPCGRSKIFLQNQFVSNSLKQIKYTVKKYKKTI